ncbi:MULTISPECIES: thiamine-phosphate kinase [Actinokineospora]|uniref:Thiamine-monophosphate kinase n=1 Tax=Actinokineospora fastidiosa TaxID=1816 RepID=A0A918LHJ0_9PSEU|nr:MULTISPECIES: thiamine-phosphate kinase [Actinokineospora]UVS81184.1 Thiamine-monophosphate kinase [Actinokineospora sp. UTMC 2448]GGS51869.1 thiamine-monophosphate kinase [Actinokineospora fastidiosa]
MGDVEETVADVGEFALIRRITGGRPKGAATLLGPGDDAAVLAAPDGRVVACTDVLVEGVHFRFDWSPPTQVGSKAAAVNLADIAAMGATPTGLLVGLACPSTTPASVVDELSAGLAAEAARARVGVVGGDMARSDTFVISVTALGSLDGRAPVTRSGAMPGDVVAVAGKLGWSAAGLAVLGRGFRSPVTVVGAHRVPAPPYAAGPSAALAGATSMIDVSDGLLADLAHIAEASTVAIDLVGGLIPVDQRLIEVASALGADARHWVLTGGEDHALAATFPSASSVPPEFRVIGSVTRGAGVTIDGKAYTGDPGWQHWR